MKKTLTKSLFETANNDETIINYRLELLKFLDTTYYESEEFLFYNMLEFTRFINDPSSIAYTDRNKLIYLNAPTPKLGNELYKWDFVFAHECLHQIYDTFAIGDLIIAELGKAKYDHYLLNIASDCVINETLSKRFRKKMPDDLITAKYLKSKYNVSYNINEDTQYTMYLKLLEVKEKQQEIYKKMMEDGLLTDNTSIHDKVNSDGGGITMDIPSEGQPGQGGQPGNKQGEGEGEGEGEGDQPGEGQGQGQGDQPGTSSKAGQEKQENSYSNEQFGEYKELLDYYDADPSMTVDELIEKQKNTLTGPLGEFIDKLRRIPGEIKKSKYGISLSADRGNKTDYMTQLFNKTKVILSNKMQSIQKKYKSTYSRVNRRRPFSDGGVIAKGRKIELDKLDINLSFYVDISGSMGDNVVNTIFSNLFANANSLNKTYMSTYKDVLNSVLFNYYAFNENISKVSANQIPRSNGGNVALDELIKYMKKHTETSLINVIITDAGFDIDNTKIINEMQNIDGFLIIITNSVSNWPGHKTIENQSDGKIIAIYSPVF